MIERRGLRPVHDVGLRTRSTDRVALHGLVSSTSTFHLRWVEYVRHRREGTIGGARVA